VPGKYHHGLRKSASDADPSPAQVSDLSRHLLRAQEEERKRISRELHDETGQALMLLRLLLGVLSTDIRAHETRQKVQQATELLDRTIGGLRRIIARLSPRVLDELGLASAIRKEVRELSKNSGIKGHVELPEFLPAIDHEIEIAVYRSVQEALHNVAKHSGARTFNVVLDLGRGSIRLLIEDDGIGFSKKKTSRKRSFGLIGMRERIAVLGGTLRVRSTRGAGTRLRVILPLSLRDSSPRRQVPFGEVVPFVNKVLAGHAS